jgi:hypothetical protein
MVEVPLYWESTPWINNQVVSDSKYRIDRADHRFWNGTDKSARPSLFQYLQTNRLGCVHTRNYNGWEPIMSPSCAAG